MNGCFAETHMMDQAAKDDDLYMTLLETAASLPAADRECYLRSACGEASPLTADILEPLL